MNDKVLTADDKNLQIAAQIAKMSSQVDQIHNSMNIVITDISNLAKAVDSIESKLIISKNVEQNTKYDFRCKHTNGSVRCIGSATHIGPHSCD
jgi:hypothetical protein